MLESFTITISIYFSISFVCFRPVLYDYKACLCVYELFDCLDYLFQGHSCFTSYSRKFLLIHKLKAEDDEGKKKEKSYVFRFFY